MADSGEPQAHPWEPRREESAQACRAFAHYLAQPRPRRLADTAEAVERSISQIRKWSSRHHWRDRAYARDVASLREEEEQERRSQQAVAERALRDAEWLQKVAMGRLGQLVRRDPQTGDLELDGELTPRDAMAMYKLGEEILRTRARTSRPETPPAAEARLDALSDQQLWDLLALARARGTEMEEPTDGND